MTIRKASLEDLAAIRCWLKSTESGFLNNWNMIENGQADGDLTVLLEGSEVVAYSLGSSTDLAILEVRKERRGSGVGRHLAQHIIDESRMSGSWGIYGFCQPQESLQFWLRVGFERVFDPHYEYRVAFPFREKQQLPPDCEMRVLKFTLHSYPDEIPYRTRSISAGLRDGIYYLTEDYLEYAAIGDMVLNISDKKKSLFDAKCKYVDDAGGERDPPWVRVQVVEPAID